MGSWFPKAMPTDGQKKFLGRLKSLSQEERFCNVHIKFSDGNRKFNSLVLASLSPFFEAMLSSSMKEGLTGEVSLPTVSVEVFDAVMSYYMDGEGELDEKALYEAVDACEMMALPDLKDVCILNMKDNLNVDSCVRIWQLSKKYTEDKNLVTAAFKMVVEHIGMICTQEDFLNLPKSEVFQIIKPDRSIMDEGLFFVALLKWIEANEPEEASITEFLGHFRFQRISKADLLKMMFQYREILKKYKPLDKAIEMYAVDGITPTPLQENKQLTSSLHKVIVVCSSSDRPILHVHAWHLSHKKWYDLSTTIPEARTQFAASAVGSKIVVTGGKAKDKVLSETLIYDSISNKWQKGPDLNTARYRHGSVEVNGKVYVVGGQKVPILNSIEIFNADNYQWEVVGNIATPVADAVVTCSGKLIVIYGGCYETYTGYSRFEKECQAFQCFDVENKSTTVLHFYHGCRARGTSESSTIYIIAEGKGCTKLNTFSIKEQKKDLELHRERIEISLPYLDLVSSTQLVVNDGVGFLFSGSCTRQLSLSNTNTQVVLPTIPGPVRDVWGGFTMFVGEKSLH